MSDLKKIHYDIKDLISENKFQEVDSYMKKILKKNDIGELRISLIILKSFRDNEIIKESFEQGVRQLEILSDSKYI